MTTPPTPAVDLPGAGPGDRPNRDLMVAVKGGGILFAGQVFEQVSGLVFAIFMGRFLGAGDYGVYKLALTIVFAVSVLATLGLAGGMTRFIPLARLMKSDARIWGVIQLGTGVPVAIGIVAAVAIILTAEPVSIGIFEEPALVSVLMLVALAIPVHAANLSLAAVVQGFKQVKYEFYAQDITFNALKLVLSVGAILLGFGVMGVTIAYVAAEVAALLLL
ncbi:MAG: oligosaccharide flippase family protein, partial [Ignavibacteria bacterium]|nr:oligosaccharide flippase family protein [Ignavibacteria bacterium]